MIRLAAALRGPHLLDRVTIVDETPYIVDPGANTGAHDRRLARGQVSPAD
jgi:hypothetical protein